MVLIKINKQKAVLQKQFLLAWLFIALGYISNAQNINVPNNNGPMGTEVNTLTGNLFLPRTDMYIPARGIDLDITFYYNSFNYNQNIDFGNGWSFNYSILYNVDTAGNVIITWGDARQETYKLNGDGSFTAPIGIFNTLSQYQPEKYLLTTKYGVQYYFDNNTVKRLTKIQDPNNNYLSFSYTDTSLTSMTNAAGQTITFYYTSGLLSSIVDAIASPTRTYSYQYDGYGNLTQITDPLGGTFKYQYLVNGPMSEITDKNSNVMDIIYNADFTVSELISCDSRKSFSYDTTTLTYTVTDYLPTATNQVTTYNYTRYSNGLTWLSKITGNCCGYTKSFNFDANGNIISITDANGNLFTNTYDNKGNLLSQTDPLNNINTYVYSSTYNELSGFTDAKGNLYSYQYDINGNPLKYIQPGNLISSATYSSSGDITTITDENGDKYYFSYDAYGNPKQITGPQNVSNILSVDARGNIKTIQDPNNNIYTATYDLLNRVTSVKDPLNDSVYITYDGNGNITAIKNKNGYTTLFSYDASDRLVGTTDPLGNQNFYTYDAIGNLIKFTDKNGNTSSFTYDNLNRLISAIDALGNTYNFSYDANGNRISSALPNGLTITDTYDKLNRLINSIDQNGTIGLVVYDKNGNINSYTNGTGATLSASYDALNRLANFTDPLGNTENFTYDNNSNLLTKTDRNNHTSQYQYDSLSRLISYVDNNGFLTSIGYDPASNITSLTDQNNHKTSYQFDVLNRVKSASYPDGSSLNWSYDNMSNILTNQLADGSVINYLYDANNHIHTKTLPENHIYTYDFDAEGRLVSAVDTNSNISFTYDALNRLTSESLNNHTTSYGYDLNSNTLKIIYPDGSNILQGYDTRNRLINIQKNNNNIVNYKYNNADQLQQIKFGNGVISNWQYDIANRLTSISTSNGNIQSESFNYDNETNKISVIKSNILNASEQYIYDANYRLIGFNQGTSQSSYTYDAVGNRISTRDNGNIISYSSNNLNQYASINGAQNINYSFDKNGNLTYDGNFYKTYDEEGRLLSDSSATIKISYQYDALGRRIRKTVNGISVNYYFAGATQLEQRDLNTDTVINETVYGGILRPITINSGHQNYFYHQNDINSVDAITDSAGNLVERYQYDVFGKPIIYDVSNNILPSSKAGNRFSFNGQEYDNETGDYHFFYRNYSPSTGSFNQKDPIEYADGTNMYQYVHNNPANGIDVLGLDDCDHQTTQPTSWWDTNALEWQLFLSGMLSNGTSVLEALQKSSVIFTREGMLVNLANTGVNIASNSGLLQFVNGTGVNALLVPYNIINTVLPARDLYNNFSTNSASQNTDDVMNVISSGTTTGVGIAGLNGVVSTGSTAGITTVGGGILFASAGIAGGLGIAGTASWAYKKATAAASGGEGQSFTEIEDVPLFTDLVKTGYDNAADYNANIGHQIFTGNYERWLQTQQKLDQRQREYQQRKMIEQQQQWRDAIRNNKTPCPPNNNGGTQKTTPPGPGNPGTPGHTNLLGAHDPNLIVGPVGVGTPKWVSINAQMPYTIFYANSASANAPARIVRINYPIDPKQDPNSFSLGSFGFNDMTFNVPPNTASYYQRLDVRDSLGLYVDVTAGLDVVNHQIFWTFESIDPATLLPPTDPTKGFLLILDSTNSSSGHGFVNYNIKPLLTDLTGDTTHAIGYIVFDYNDTIPTNYTKNTIDAVAPTSQINPLLPVSSSTTISLSWSGSDDPGGSGLQSYTLYVSSNGGTSYTVLASGITRTDTTFTGANNTTYSFFVLATDSAGNTEVLRPGATTSVFINAQVILPVTWLYFNASNQGNNNLLSWATGTEVNTKEFEIERSIDGVNFISLGTMSAAGNSHAQTNYNYLDRNVTDLNVTTVYYRLKQISNDGTYTYTNIVAVNLPTTLPIVKVYPNPFKQLLNLMIGNISTISKDDNALLYTAEGKLLYQHKLDDRLLNQFVTLNDLPQLASGTYILKLTLNHQQYSFTIIRQ